MHKLKYMLMEKLDQMADKYKNKEPQDIPQSVLDSWCKTTEIIENISTVEAMEEYGDDMSGTRRSSRTGRYISGRDNMDGMSRRMYRRSYDDESYGDESYGKGAGMEAELEDMANDRSLPNSKREAARKMLAEIRKGDL